MQSLFLVTALLLSPQDADLTTTDDPAEPNLSVTQHSGVFGGQALEYEAVAGELFLRDDEGNPEASFFYTSYSKVTEEPSLRAVTFLWNGGPGSSSVWLHMGVFGPVRVDVPSDAKDDGGAPYSVVPKEGAFLDLSDIVFIDPIGTGFSRALGEKDVKFFYGVQQDARSIARFIRQWISVNERWN